MRNKGNSYNEATLLEESFCKKEKRNFISIIASWIVVAYYTLEFIVGRFIISGVKRRCGIVLFDRYYYDFFVQPTTRNLIWRFRKLLLFFVQKPDITIHLIAPPEVLYERKRELKQLAAIG